MTTIHKTRIPRNWTILHSRLNKSFHVCILSRGSLLLLICFIDLAPMRKPLIRPGTGTARSYAAWWHILASGMVGALAVFLLAVVYGGTVPTSQSTQHIVVVFFVCTLKMYERRGHAGGASSGHGACVCVHVKLLVNRINCIHESCRRAAKLRFWASAF